MNSKLVILGLLALVAAAVTEAKKSKDEIIRDMLVSGTKKYFEKLPNKNCVCRQMGTLFAKEALVSSDFGKPAEVAMSVVTDERYNANDDSCAAAVEVIKAAEKPDLEVGSKAIRAYFAKTENEDPCAKAAIAFLEATAEGEETSKAFGKAVRGYMTLSSSAKNTGAGVKACKIVAKHFFETLGQDIYSYMPKNEL